MTYTSIVIEEERKKINGVTKSLFPHQQEAYKALSTTFTFPSTEYKGGLVVIPTGGEKTFTAVNWICNDVLSKGIKVLWLAQSSNLLDQAYETFINTVVEIPNRNQINIRVVSSSPSHANSFSIDTTDDILIITTQSAIKQYYSDALDLQGKQVETALKKFIQCNKGQDFLVVLDEAHHAPAYGCRNLLMDIKSSLGNYYLLGLTATPTYTDKRRRGWLFEIFDQEIIYEAKQTELIAQNILALPNYIEKSTGREYEVDDRLYDRLVRKHKDLPEDIVEKLANDSARNNYIINEYVHNKKIYGKTIIFVDRWFQCVYMETKFKELGIRAGSIFSKIDANPGSVEERNNRTKTDNERILKEFKDGKLDVLLNVRMLAEGADIPDAKTVFITRQTTSSILLTQMIGRVLRGKKAGGGENKSKANIVLFMDNWKQVINWANPKDGETNPDKPSVRGYIPVEYISIHLIEKLGKDIQLGQYSNVPVKKMIPVGWYTTEITVNVSENGEEETKSVIEYVMVYEDNCEAFKSLVSHICKTTDLDEEIWGNENFDFKFESEQSFKEVVDSQIEKLKAQFFESDYIGIGNTLEWDMISVIRHIMQNKVLGTEEAKPKYYSFDLRKEFDMEKLVNHVLENKLNDLQQIHYLQNEFNKTGSLWKQFYKTFYNFKMAFEVEKMRILTIGTIIYPPGKKPIKRELSEEEKKQVIQRDRKCLCCGLENKRSLVIDHIIPFSMGGETSIQNSQTLCKVCNGIKKDHAINFKDVHQSPLISPKDLYLYEPRKDEHPVIHLKRIINFFYHCNAVSNIKLHVRSNGTNYSVWEIELFPGNQPDWLELNKKELLKYIRNVLGYDHVRKLKIKV